MHAVHTAPGRLASLRIKPINKDNNNLVSNLPPSLENALKVCDVVTETLSPDVKLIRPSFEAKEGAATSVLRVGKYVITDIGKSGVVPQVRLYRAVNVETQLRYVCKVMPVSQYRQILAPYFILGDHPHVSSIEELLIGSTQVYAFFPSHLDDLHSYIRLKKRIPEREAVQLFKQMVAAVSYCLGKKVLLRDLKLRKFVFKDLSRTELMLDDLEDSVVLSSPDNLQEYRNHGDDGDVMDAVDKDVDDTLTDRHGCPAYVSPEILSTLPQGSGGQLGVYSGKAACVWSLGVILYTMLVGQYPFHDSDPSVLFAKICRGRFALPEGLSPQARCMLRGMLRCEPRDRADVRDLATHPWVTRAIQTPSRPRQQGIPSQGLRTALGGSTGVVQNIGVSNIKTIGDIDQMVPDYKPVQVNDSFFKQSSDS